MSHMLLSQEGFKALAHFTIAAEPSSDDKNDGLMLTCTQDHSQHVNNRWHWPGHVAAPSLMHLSVVAGNHWWKHHSAPEESHE